MEATTQTLPPAPPPPPTWRRPWYRRWWGMLIVTALSALFLYIGSVLLLVFTTPEAPIGATERFSRAGEEQSVQTVDRSRLVRDTDHSLGSSEATVQIVEFADFECPFCREAYTTMRSASLDYGDQVNVVFRHFPLSSIHDRALATAEAAECAREQGKFWQYHDRLYQYQPQFSDDELVVHAQAVGVDTDRFTTCVRERRYRSIVERDIADGKALGVVGTPTWFINGTRVEGVIPPEQFRAIIDSLIRVK